MSKDVVVEVLIAVDADSDMIQTENIQKFGLELMYRVFFGSKLCPYDTNKFFSHEKN
jgi:hypothetical protein